MTTKTCPNTCAAFCVTDICVCTRAPMSWCITEPLNTSFKHLQTTQLNSESSQRVAVSCCFQWKAGAASVCIEDQYREVQITEQFQCQNIYLVLKVNVMTSETWCFKDMTSRFQPHCGTSYRPLPSYSSSWQSVQWL